MRDPRLDQLAETANNRGLKLVRSRIRTPGKRRFGKVGLSDSSGKPVFGMDAKGPLAAPEAVEDYLRNLDAHDWGASLDVAVPPRKRKVRKTPPAAANDTKPEPRRPAAPKVPQRKVRESKPSDAPRLVELIHELGHDVSEKQVRKNLASLTNLAEAPLVATLDGKVVGMCGISSRVVIHRPAPLGRITALVVASDAKGQGLGRLLVESAEAWMRKRGCQLVEVTSNDRRAEAHAFYRHMGYERSSIRFFKRL